MSAPPTITETITTNNKTLLTINMTNVTKLTQENYLMWKLQVHALIDGYGLAGHLDGSTEIPPATTVIDTVATPNPDFVVWKRQDQLIYNALLGSITLHVQSTLSRTTTAAQIWNTLAATYAKPSRGYVKQIKDQIEAINKGSSTIDEYLHSLITRFDKLASLGRPLEHEEQIEAILEGLPEEYRNIIDQIEARDVALSITYVHERLRTQEAKLLKKATSSVLPITANVATQRNNNLSRNNNNTNKNHSNNNQATTWQPTSNRTEQRSYRPYLGKCQFCNVQGHSARRCPQLQQRLPSATPPQTNPFTPWQPRANLAIGTSLNPNDWLLDSGATHHLTSDLNNLSLHQPYTGGEDVLIGDGSGLPITHTGFKTLPSRTRPLALHNVL